VASDYNQNPQAQSTLAPELVMVQIKLQEQLVQRHKKLQEAIVQQQKELQAVQQQLLVAQQFLIHSNPYLQGLLPPTSQPVSQAQPSMPSASSTLTLRSGLEADPSVSAHSSLQAVGTQQTASYFSQMLQESQQQQQHDEEQKLKQQQQQQQQLLQQQLMFQSRPMMPSSPSLGFLAGGQVQVPSAALPVVQPDSSTHSFTTPRLTAPAITTPSLSMARMSSGLSVDLGRTDSLSSAQLVIPAPTALSPLSPSAHDPSSPNNSLSRAGSSAAAESMPPADYSYQMQVLSPSMDPSSMGLMQQLMMPPRTQTGQ
jgi:hypothetical protein